MFFISIFDISIFRYSEIPVFRNSDSVLPRQAQLLQVFVCRTITNQNLILTRLHTHCIRLRVPELEALMVKCQLDGLCLTSLHADALEGSKRLQRAIGVLQVADVELHNLRAVALTNVLDVDSKIEARILG